MQQERWVVPDWGAAINWCKKRNRQGIRCVFDILGEFAKDEAEVSGVVDGYLRLINAIADDGLGASVTVKLTALGGLFDKAGCEERALKIAKYSDAKKIGFEMDMEGRDLAEYTLSVAEACYQVNPNVTLTLQAYLNRTPVDLVAVMRKGIKPRLVKGAYLGDTNDFEEIQGRLRALAEKAIASCAQFQIGTHDPELLSWVKQRAGLQTEMVEFSFLKGLADCTKVEMAEGGWAVSEYVPYGANMEPYIGRRLKYLRYLKRLGRAPAP